MQTKIAHPHYDPPKHDSAKERWTYSIPVVWDEVIWEVWARPPRRRAKRPFAKLWLIARDGAPIRASYMLRWQPTKLRVMSSVAFKEMERDRPGFAKRVESLLAKTYAGGTVPGTEVASNG